MNFPHLAHAWKHFRQYGAISLFFEALSYISAELHRRLTSLYWLVKRDYELTIKGKQLRFYAVPEEARHELESFNKENEGILLENFVDEINESDSILDVGANIGVFTCFAAATATNGEVLAFEPYPPNTNLIRRNLQKNDLSADIFQMALSDKSGSVSLSVPTNNILGWGKSTLEETSDKFPTETKSISVSAMTIDELVNSGQIPLPDVVKIDVEGAEPKVLDGMTQLLRKKSIRCLFIEVHRTVCWRPSIEDFGITEAEFREELRSYGYELTELHERGGVVHLKATQT